MPADYPGPPRYKTAVVTGSANVGRTLAHATLAELGRKANYPIQAAIADAKVRVMVADMRKHGLSLDMTMTEERYQFYCRRLESWRPICPKRARKLRRRGDHVRYLPEFGSDAWQPPHLKRKNA